MSRPTPPGDEIFDDSQSDAQGNAARGLDRFLVGRGAAAAAAGIATALIVLMLAGPRWPVVAWEVLTDGVIVLLWMAAAAGWGCQPVRFLRVGGHRPLLSFVSSVALGLGVVGFITLGLGLAAILNRATAWSVVIAGVVLAIVYVRRLPHGLMGRLGRVRHWARQPAGPDWLWVLASPVLATLLLSALVPPGFLWGMNEPNGYDVLAYHLQVPREWYEIGRIAPLAHNVFSYFPMGVETHYLLAMHLTGGPWAGMFAAQLMHAALTLLTVAAVYAFAAERGAAERGIAERGIADRGAAVRGIAGRGVADTGMAKDGTVNRQSAPPGRLIATLAGITCLCVPWLVMTGGIAYNEGGLLLFGTLAVVWSVGGRSNERGAMGEESKNQDIKSQIPDYIHHPSPNCHHCILAGIFAGLAGGAKLTGVPLFVIGLPLAILTTTRRGNFLPTLRGLACFVLAAIVFLSPCLIRNIVWTGNPVFPQAASVLGKAHFSAVQVERWERAHEPPPGKKSVVARIGEFKNQVLADDRYAYVLVPLGLVSLWLARDRAAALIAVMLAGLVVFWIGFTHLQGRFFLPAVPLLAMGVGLVRGRMRAALLTVPVIGLLIIASVSLQRRADMLSAELYRRAGVVLSDLIGVDAIDSAAQDALASLPPDATLGLVGDAGAFMYRRPTPLLRYRSVFDVDARDGEDVMTAWTRNWPAGSTLLVMPSELDRFARTYHGIPALAPEFTRDRPIVMRK